jgi:hypothetical protein
MTFNWGHKLTIGFIAFAGMIVYMVVQSMNTRYELVSNEYYKDELQYQQVIDGTSRANQLSSKTTVTQQNDDLVIQLPAEMQEKIITGSLWFYNATDSKKDKKLALQVTDKATQNIDSKLFMPGTYTAKISWQSNGVNYYSEVPVTIH